MQKSVLLVALFVGASAFAEKMPARAFVAPCQSEQLAIEVISAEKPVTASQWVAPLVVNGGDPVKMTFAAEFKRPLKWYFRRTVLRFPAAERPFSVKVNGTEVGSSEGDGYPVEFDISAELKLFGGNRIEVSGMEPKNALLVSEWKWAPKELIVETTLADDLKSGSFIVRDENGRTIKERKSDSPNMWTPESPYLYVTPCEYKVGWWIFGWTEHYAVAFAFRKIEMTDAGLVLNGKRYRFHGVDRRTPKLMTEPCSDLIAMVKNLRTLKAKNVDAVLVSGTAGEADWYNLCDREGLAVISTGSDSRAKSYFKNSPSIFFVKAKELGAVGEFAAEGGDEKEMMNRFRRIFATAFDWTSGKAVISNDYAFAEIKDYNLILSGYKDGKRVFRCAAECPEVPMAATISAEVFTVEDLAKCDAVGIDFHDGTHVVGGDKFSKGK